MAARQPPSSSSSQQRPRGVIAVAIGVVLQTKRRAPTCPCRRRRKECARVCARRAVVACREPSALPHTRAPIGRVTKSAATPTSPQVAATRRRVERRRKDARALVYCHSPTSSGGGRSARTSCDGASCRLPLALATVLTCDRRRRRSSTHDARFEEKKWRVKTRSVYLNSTPDKMRA